MSIAYSERIKSQSAPTDWEGLEIIGLALTKTGDQAKKGRVKTGWLKVPEGYCFIIDTTDLQNQSDVLGYLALCRKIETSLNNLGIVTKLSAIIRCIINIPGFVVPPTASFVLNEEDKTLVEKAANAALGITPRSR